jgi:hypothetical protein
VSYGANNTTYQAFTHANPGIFTQGKDPVYTDRKVTDGQKFSAAVNYGWQLGKKKGSFLNATLNYDQREPTIRSGERTGDIDNRTSGDAASNALLSQLGVNRDFFQMRVGQSRTRNIQGVINSAIKLKGESEFYFFSILGQRNGNSTGFYRMPYQATNIPAIYPKGFLPEISSTIRDIAVGTGIKGRMGTWNYDLSNGSTALFGTDATKPLNGRALLWAGNALGDENLRYAGSENDRDPILVALGGSLPTAVATGYVKEDVNMDGRVRFVGSNNDREPVLVNVGGTLPTATRAEQLP